MPSYRCLDPLCTNYVKEHGYCADCQQKHGQKGTRHTYYNQHLRDPEAVAFYNSAAWKRARSTKLSAQPTCQRCGKLADTVHHLIPLKDCTPAQKTDQKNLASLCRPCHSELEREVSLVR